MVTKRDYTGEAVSAARSVLIELNHLLGEYREHIVVIGGWVPDLVIPPGGQKHVGSMDVDIAINHKEITEAGYRTMLELLISRGYRQGQQPFIFLRDVVIGEHVYEVEIDLMAGEYAGTGKSHRHQQILDIHARKGRGIDLVFREPVNVQIRGELPGGGLDSVVVKVSSIPVFIVMKCMALADRLKEKDAWDVYYCIRGFPGGIESLSDEFGQIANHGLTNEAVGILAEKFSSPEAIGPKFVADFEELSELDARAVLQRDAFERVNALVHKIFR